MMVQSLVSSMKGVSQDGLGPDWSYTRMPFVTIVVCNGNVEQLVKDDLGGLVEFGVVHYYMRMILLHLQLKLENYKEKDVIYSGGLCDEVEAYVQW